MITKEVRIVTSALLFFTLFIGSSMIVVGFLGSNAPLQPERTRPECEKGRCPEFRTRSLFRCELLGTPR